MPEGHTLHRLASHMEALFVGRPWMVTSPQGRFAAGAQLLSQATSSRAEAWGKHFFMHAGAHIWHVHLGLYGAFSFRGDEKFAGPESIGAPRTSTTEFHPQYDESGWLIPQTPHGAIRARVRSEHGWADLRGPATCSVITSLEYERILQRLGPDPLRKAAGSVDRVAVEKFAQNLARRRIPIGAALMDQSVIAGVGNIYRAESLFVRRINPETPSNTLSFEEITNLWGLLNEQLWNGVREGVIRTLRPEDELVESAVSPSEPLGGDDYHDYLVARNHGQRRHWVYKHEKTPCLRCGAVIASRDLNGRTLYWCPGCQSG